MNPAELFRQETDPLRLAAGDFLFREGDSGEKVYVLLEGEMEILLGDLVLENAGPGTLIGEIGGNRPAAVPFSCATDATFRHARDEDVG